jgi:5-deoxy-glucuronate isomerase
MNYKREWTPVAGRSSIVRPGDAGLKQIGFDMVRLAAGERSQIAAEAKETALVVLSGTASLKGDGFAFDSVGGRKDVFSGLPATVYLPAHTACAIEATSDLEIAICTAPSDRAGKVCLVRPEDVKQVTIGKDNWQRRAYMIVDDRVPAQYLFIGEAIVPPGNWSSFPPHRHDFDALPDEVDLEEIYFFRFQPAGGFGIQKVYTDDRSIDETITVTENDTVLIPRGYHPVVAAPGYSMYYLWIMAGVNRRFLQRLDPAHRWVAQG